jgi:glycosyltransferase involved in cell wall biosynthesis
MSLTALMPVHDYHPVFLRKAVDSMFAQTSPDWRLVVIAEPERRDEIARALAAALADPRIELIANRGRKLAGALNTGTRHARTAFVGILLGDDMWSPDAVAVLTGEILAHPEVDFFHSSRRVIGAEDEPVTGVLRSRDVTRLEDFGPSPPVKHLLCWRRAKALAVGGMDETLNSVGPDDFDFPWTMAEHGAKFRAVPDCLYLYRHHHACFRLTTDLPRSVHLAELRRIMRKHGMGRLAIARHLLEARRTYLRQCLYRSPLERWVRERARLRPRVTSPYRG